jgi:hypothetical protein
VQILRKFNENMVHSEWEGITLGVTQGSILSPLLFFLYINDLPRTFNNISLSVLFINDTMVFITNKNRMNFQNKINIVFNKLNKCFTANQLALNYEKTKYILSLTLVIQIIWVY